MTSHSWRGALVDAIVRWRGSRAVGMVRSDVVEVRRRERRGSIYRFEVREVGGRWRWVIGDMSRDVATKACVYCRACVGGGAHPAVGIKPRLRKASRNATDSASSHEKFENRKCDYSITYIHKDSSYHVLVPKR